VVRRDPSKRRRPTAYCAHGVSNTSTAPPVYCSLLTALHSPPAAIHHLGWVVRSVEASRKHFETVLGFPFLGSEDFPGLTVAFFDGGSIMIELLEPRDPGSEFGKFLARTGGGIHHFALSVGDIAGALAEAERHGLALIDRAPRPGARGTTIAYVDPHREDGILIQFVQGRVT
jgi:methylmalonyl-CoA/ethylmalonyl-CoA epimerase